MDKILGVANMQEYIPPAPPRWYHVPKQIKVKVERIERWPLGEEVAILVRFDSVSKTAFVPEWAVDEESMTVEASEIGMSGDSVLISLPPSSMGGTILQVPKAHLAELVA